MKIRKNDTVLVIAGKDRGKKGKVRFAYPDDALDGDKDVLCLGHCTTTLSRAAQEAVAQANQLLDAVDVVVLPRFVTLQRPPRAAPATDRALVCGLGVDLVTQAIPVRLLHRISQVGEETALRNQLDGQHQTSSSPASRKQSRW